MSIKQSIEKGGAKSGQSTYSASYEWTPRGHSVTIEPRSSLHVSSPTVPLSATKNELSIADLRDTVSETGPDINPSMLPEPAISRSISTCPSISSLNSITPSTPPPRSRNESSTSAVGLKRSDLPVPPPQRKLTTLAKYTIEYFALHTEQAEYRSFPKNSIPPIHQAGIVGLLFTDKLFILATRNEIKAFTQRSSLILWTIQTDLSIITLQGDYLWYGSTDGTVSVLRVQDGTELYSTRFHGSPIKAIWCIDKLCFSLSQNGVLLSWTHNGEAFAHNKHQINSGFTAASFIYPHIWLSCGRKIIVYKLGKDDGELVLSTSYHLDDVRYSNYPNCTTSSPISTQLQKESLMRCKLVTIDGDSSGVYCALDNGNILHLDHQNQKLQVTAVSMSGITCLKTMPGLVCIGLKSGSVLLLARVNSELHLIREWVCPELVKSRSRSSAEAIIGLDYIISQDLLVCRTSGASYCWDAKSLRAEIDLRYHDDNITDFSLSLEVLTWNVDCANPDDLSVAFFEKSMLYQESCSNPDVISIGLQEVIDLGDKSKTAKQLVKGGSSDTQFEHERWNSLFDSTFGKHGYNLVSTQSLVGLHSCLFVKTDILGNVSDIMASSIKTGLGGLHGNKGATLFSFCIKGKSICIVNCHLAAGTTSIIQRNHDAESVLVPKYNATLPEPPSSGAYIYPLKHDFCIFAGDTNYRINTARELALKHIENQDWESLYLRDQLGTQLFKNPSFVLGKFSEAHIRFAPTYKFDRGTNKYDTSDKKRVPAWCDRILYSGRGIKVRTYQSLDISVSDHKPVLGLFQIGAF